MTRIDEHGHGLLESIVALTLFLTVLIPASQAWMRFLKTQDSRLHSEAIDLAVVTMEELLHRLDTVREGTLDSEPSGRLRASATVRFEERLACVMVTVTHHTKADTLYQLYTERVIP